MLKVSPVFFFLFIYGRAFSTSYSLSNFVLKTCRYQNETRDARWKDNDRLTPEGDVLMTKFASQFCVEIAKTKLLGLTYEHQ